MGHEELRNINSNLIIVLSKIEYSPKTLPGILDEMKCMLTAIKVLKYDISVVIVDGCKSFRFKIHTF